MADEVTLLSSYLEPGHVFLPAKATQLCAVVGFGVVITLFDRARQMGGMCHYLYPYRQSKKDSTAMYAGPAIVALVKMLTSTGSKNHDLEANMYGGGSGPADKQDDPKVGAENVKVGMEILDRMGVTLSSQDVGGHRGRKVVFTSDTGETAVLKANRIRASDWMPDPKLRRR